MQAVKQNTDGLTADLTQSLILNKPITDSWSLNKKTPINDYITQFEFVCKGFSVKTEVTDIRNLGRHMKVDSLLIQSVINLLRSIIPLILKFVSTLLL